jgi:hypothetical protein
LEILEVKGDEVPGRIDSGMIGDVVEVGKDGEASSCNRKGSLVEGSNLRDRRRSLTSLTVSCTPLTYFLFTLCISTSFSDFLQGPFLPINPSNPETVGEISVARTYFLFGLGASIVLRGGEFLISNNAVPHGLSLLRDRILPCRRVYFRFLRRGGSSQSPCTREIDSFFIDVWSVCRLVYFRINREGGVGSGFSISGCSDAAVSGELAP